MAVRSITGFDAGGKSISNIADGSASSDAASKAQLDTKPTVVDAGSTAGTARPSTSAVVIWLVNYGITPTNALSTDVILERGDTGADSAALNPAVEAGFFGWSFDPSAAASQTAPGTQALILVRVKARKSGTINNLNTYVGTAGATLTYARMAIFDITAGTQLGISADQSTAFTTTGAKACALTAGVTVAMGTEYLIGTLQVGTTPAALLRGYSGGAGNFGYSSAPFRHNQLTGQATMPATITPSSLAASSVAWCVAMSA